MEYYDRQVFTGPPESARETILVAAKALEKGDWKTCKQMILSLPVIQLIPNKDGTQVSFPTVFLLPKKNLFIAMRTCEEHIFFLFHPLLTLLAVVAILGKEIQEQGLRTYLFAYGQYYDSLSLDKLCSMFELEENGTSLSQPQ